MKILKFGGSSVATPERIKNIAAILQGYKHEQFGVVFSAFGGVTDDLLGAAKASTDGHSDYLTRFEKIAARHRQAVTELLGVETEPQVEFMLQELHNLLNGLYLLRELSNRSLDLAGSFGERLSTYIISKYFKKEGFDAEFLDARTVIRTTSDFTNARVEFDTTFEKIKDYFSKTDKIQVITGFVGANADGATTTLGRGGSDYTASIFGAALDAESVEIWTDVDGVMTSDPRKVPSAFTVKQMTYNEAMEMSHFGAKVIYAPTMLPLRAKSIPLYIKNTFNPKFEGTLICSEPDRESRQAVSGIASIGDVSLLTLEGGGMVGVTGTAQRLFGALADEKINIMLITQASSEHSITFAVLPEEAPKASQAIRRAFSMEIREGRLDEPRLEAGMSVVAIIGENMKRFPGIAGKTFQALGKNGINISAIAQGSSELNISLVVSKKDQIKALNALHEIFFSSDVQVLHLFMAGTGLIGRTLLKQIQQQSDMLLKRQNTRLSIVALSNSRKMLFDKQGITVEDWEDELMETGEEANTEAFIRNMQDYNLPNSIFIDNTASADFCKHYFDILNGSISISASNKIAASSEYAYYQKLKNTARRRNVQFLYETNVGAGLPILNTLHDLMVSGDRLLRVEAALSGTLSYIFTTFSAGMLFSELVAKAKELGYTEPDPRDDLSCLDVARKLLILARESGFAFDMGDIAIKPILPEACLQAPDIDSFFKVLATYNDYYENLRSDAAQKGEALRVIARLENGKASVGLESVPASHPFYALSGSDNLLVFTTERYNARPLVVRGPGAGADVTAAGVFAEILRIGNFLS